MKPRTRTKAPLRREFRPISRSKAANVPVRRATAPQVLLVLGMHRSGTSALARVFSLLGADLPKNVLDANPTNEAGHWESVDLVTVHDELLASAGSQWDDWRAFNSDWAQSGVAESYSKKLIGVLRNDFTGSPLFVVKDPRISRFVPFWLDVIERFGAEAHGVISVRNPLEVAASLKRRNAFPPAKSYLLWLRHVLDAERATRHLPRAIVTYNDLLNDWRGVVGAVATTTGLHWPRRSDRADFEIDHFLADELRHHVADDAQLIARTDIVDWVKESYRLLQQMANRRETRDHLKRLDRIHFEFDKACVTFGLVLLSEREQIEARLRSTELQVNTRDEEVVRLSAELTQAQSVVNAVRASALKSASASFEQELATLRNIAQEREAMLTKLRSEVDIVQSLENDRKVEIDQLYWELKSKQSMIMDRDREIDQLSHAVEVARHMLRDSQTEVQRLAGEYDSARLDIARSNVESERASDILTSKLRELDSAHSQINRLQDELQSAVTQAIGIRDLEMRLRQTSIEKDGLADELAFRTAELASRTAAWIEGENKARAQIRLLQDQLIDAEAGLAKARKARNTASWMGPFSKFRRAVRQLTKSGLVDAEWYLREYPSVAKSGRSPVEHYLEEGYLHGYWPNSLFDTRWYLERYEDVRRSGLNPVIHYLTFGSTEGRDPGPNFQTYFYLQTNPDVRRSGMNPLVHYLRYGRHEGRLPVPPV